MGAGIDNKFTPVKPYDDSMWDSNSIYDKMPYTWDPDLNVDRIFARISGNIIKAYRCRIDEPFEVKYK